MNWPWLEIRRDDAMPAPFLIIDGYNVLYAAGMGQADYRTGDLQRCRDRLLRFLAARLKSAQLARALVIFDARDPPPDLPARRRQHGMQILFAQPHGDADLMIEELIRDHPHPRQVVLISSDQRLRRTARVYRAKSIASEQFIADLPDSTPAAGLDDERLRQGAVSGLEAAKWLEAFGTIEMLDEPLPPGLLTRSGLASIERPALRQPPAAAARPAAEKKRTVVRAQDRAVDQKKPAPATARQPPQAPRGKNKSAPSSLPPDRRQLTNDDLAYWLEVFRELPER